MDYSSCSINIYYMNEWVNKSRGEKSNFVQVTIKYSLSILQIYTTQREINVLWHCPLNQGKLPVAHFRENNYTL